VDVHHIESIFLRVRRRITVMRPHVRDRQAAQEPSAVLYLNDGQNLFDPARAFAGNTWRVAETVNWLAGERRIPPILVVGIDHGEVRRAREYLPVEDERNPFARRPLGRQYVEFVTREVVPFVERTYQVSRRTSARAFGGSSYGAVAALLAVLERPGTFGRLLLESPSLYVGNRIMLRKARRAPRWPARVYLGVGTAETSKADVNRETVENVRVLESILEDAGLGPKRLKVVVQEGATHSEGAWAGRLGEALTFLFGRSGLPPRPAAFPTFHGWGPSNPP
jgi:predicted alpha/beta superfamily hydrolase